MQELLATAQFLFKETNSLKQEVNKVHKGCKLKKKNLQTRFHFRAPSAVSIMD
jgi:hypothetical protein